MGFDLTNAVIAMIGGLVVGVVLFVPFVALSYRHRGRLTFWRLIGWTAGLVYFVAIWSYTLLPLPDREAIVCVGYNLDPCTLVRDMSDALASGNILRSTAFLQLALNVALFVPLGAFVRLLFGRGFLVATAAGLLVSTAVEFTQLTGVWGIYPCAYRVFDVVDLMTNTSGALLGSLLALLVPRRIWSSHAPTDASLPHPVTRGRRLLAVLCDGLAAILIAYAAAVGARIVFWLVQNELPEAGAADQFGTLFALAVTLIIVLATGRTIGDFAVELRYVSRQPAVISRPLRFLAGIGGCLILTALPEPWNSAPLLFVIVVFLTVFVTENGRGLPGLAMAARLTDAREPTGSHRVEARESSGDESRS